MSTPLHPAVRTALKTALHTLALGATAALLSACGGGDDDGSAGAGTTAAKLSCDTSHYVAGAVELPTADQLAAYAGTYDGDEGAFGPNPGDAFVKSGSASLVLSAGGAFSYKGVSYTVTSACIDKVANGTGSKFLYIEAGKGLIDITGVATAHGSSPADGTTVFQNGVKK